MKKTFTLLIFVFLANALLFGQCPDEATPNPTYRTFNMSYFLESDRDAAWNALDSITFPAGTGCMCGATITIPKAELVIDGPVSANNVYRIRAITTINDNFGGENGNFEGNLTFIMTDGTSVTCEYDGTTSSSEVTGYTPIEIFPNPVNDQLTLINGEGKVTIFNCLGQPVKALNIVTNQETIQLADLVKGQYYIQIVKEDRTIVIKQFSKTY